MCYERKRLFNNWCFNNYSIYNFYKSVKQSDIEFVSENVNWASLRNGFKKDFKEIINKSLPKKKSIEEKKEICKTMGFEEETEVQPKL